MKKFLLFSLFVMGTWSAHAQVPQTITYQGIAVLANGDPVPNGNVQVNFVFYNDPTAGVIKYNTGTFDALSYKGMFTAIIGNSLPSAAINPPIPSTIWSEQLYVQVTVANVVQSPRIALSTTPYAFKAENANTMDAAGLTGTLNPARIAAGTLDNTLLASGIDASKLTTGTLPIARIADGSVTSAKITDATIATGDIADNAITTAKIIDNAVTTAEIGTAGVTDANKVLATDANGDPLWFTPANGRTLLGVVVGTNVQAYNANLDDLSDGSLSGSKVGTGIDATNITTGTLPIARIADGAVTSAKITDATIATGDLADNAITNAKIGDDAVTVAEIGTTGAPDANKVLTTDGAGNPQWVANGTSAIGLTAGNGLTLSSNFAELGGTLSKNTFIGTTGNPYHLFVTGGGSLAIGSSITPLSKFEVGGSTAIGNGYAGVNAAPANGLLVQGSVGIGTGALTVANKFVVDAASDDIMRITRDNTGGSSGIAKLLFSNRYSGGENVLARIGITDGGTNKGVLTFETKTNTTFPDATTTEKMRIDALGNVGIGTTSPSTTLSVGTNKFNVAGTDGDLTFSDDDGSITFAAATATNFPMIQMFASGTSNSDRMVISHSAVSSSWGLQYQDVGDKFNFLSAGAGVMTVDLLNSRVGVGTTSPSYDLHVLKGSSGTLAYFDNNSTTGGTGLVAIVNATATGAGTRYGVQGQAYNGQGFNYGVYGYANSGTYAYGIYGTQGGGATTKNYAGYFNGDVHVAGTLSKSTGSFKIDHPQAPEEKYLSHSFVESPDMMNVYNGNIETDGSGTATVELPLYFETLNKDFRYQLTAIGAFAQAVIWQEISNNTFVIKTDKPNIKVSWQVTGIRKDPAALYNAIIVEENKKPNEIGKYLNPEAYGKPKEMGIHYHKPEGDEAKPNE